MGPKSCEYLRSGKLAGSKCTGGTGMLIVEDSEGRLAVFKDVLLP